MVRKRLVIGTLLSFLAVMAGITWVAESLGQAGYDQYGYNYSGRTFNGLYENADRNPSNNTGDQTRLQMAWNELFNLAQPDLSLPGAWVTNFQRGTYVGPNGQTYRWSYSVKIVYTGPRSPALGYFTLEQESYVDGGGSAAPRYKPPVLPAPGP